MWLFLNPMFLWAAAAASIPLLLHLFARRQKVHVRFSTVRFLVAAQQKSSRRAKLENVLLLLLRSAILLLLALAFALPVIRTTALGQALGRSRRDVAIVIDTSFSMGYSTGAREVWQEARDAAESLLDGLGEGDRVCLFAAGEDVTPLVPEPEPDLRVARARLEGLEPSDTSSRLLPAVFAAAHALATAGQREKELFIITDGQALPWSDFHDTRQDRSAAATNTASAAWNPEPFRDTVTFFTLLAGATEPANASPADITLSPPVQQADRPGELVARLATSGNAGTVPMTLFIDGREEARREPETGQRETRFVLPSLSAGRHAARIETPHDALAADNSLHFLIDVQRVLPVLAVGADSDLFFLRRALSPVGGGGVEVREAAPAEIPLAELRSFSAVFLANAFPLDGPTVQALESYVRQGGLLVVFPGERAEAASYAALSILPGTPERILDVPPEDRRRMLWLLQPRDPLLDSLRLPPGSAPVVNIRRMLAWNQFAEGAEAILGAQGEQPFMVARDVDQGRVLFFAVAADRTWSDFPLSPFFLPMLHLAAQHGAGLGSRPPFVSVTRDFQLARAGIVPGEGQMLTAPDGADVSLSTVRNGANLSTIVPGWLTPGIYTIVDASGPRPELAVNLDRAESDVTPISAEEIRELIGVERHYLAASGADLSKLVDDFREGRPLAEVILWAVLALAVMEMLLSNWASRKHATLSATLSVSPAGQVKEHAS